MIGQKKKPTIKKPTIKKPTIKKSSIKKGAGRKKKSSIKKNTRRKKKSSIKKNTRRKKKAGGNDVYKKLCGSYFDSGKCSKLMENTFGKTYEPYIVINNIDNRLTYTSKENVKLGLHIGQRKLLLSEVQFLTHNTQKYCIYPGSAPSHKTHFLSKMFPDVKFILVDPNIFEIKLVEDNTIFRNKKHDDIITLYHAFPTRSHKYKKNKRIEKMTVKEVNDMIKYIEKSNHKIYIIEDYMTDKLATIFKKLKQYNFIEDIRSNVTNKKVTDFDVIWNRSMVHNWMHILKPEISMVKFRVPFYGSREDFSKYGFAKPAFDESKKYGVDFINDHKNKKFKMSKATLYLQAWAGSSSTEMRGWITKNDIDNIIQYNTVQIENTLFYYNKIMRINYHKNRYANKNLHFCNCNDCAIESTIWHNYINKIAKKDKRFPKNMHKVNYYIKLTNKLTSRPLSAKHNQTIYEPMTYKILTNLVNTKNNSTEYGHALNRGNTGMQL